MKAAAAAAYVLPGVWEQAVQCRVPFTMVCQDDIFCRCTLANGGHSTIANVLSHFRFAFSRANNGSISLANGIFVQVVVVVVHCVQKCGDGKDGLWQSCTVVYSLHNAAPT